MIVIVLMIIRQRNLSAIKNFFVFGHTVYTSIFIRNI